MPTLDDYAYGASSLVERLGPALRQGAPIPDELLADLRAGRVLRDLGARFSESTADGRTAALRIVDFHRDGSTRADLVLEARLQGFSREDPSIRVAALRKLRLALGRDATAPSWRILSAASLDDSPFQRGRPHLREAAAEHGLVARHDTLDPVEATNTCIAATHHRPGVLLVDVDGDGDLDVVTLGKTARLFLNDGHGHFTDATAGSGLDALPIAEASGGVAADVDGDGLPELFLTGHVTPCRMLKNEGGGHFRDVTADWGLAGLSGPFTSAVFFDADRDGRVDLFVACYGDARRTGPAYDGFNGGGSRFFHDVGKGGAPFFVDETHAAGLADRGWSFAASACDFDDDGDDDLYVANDFGLNSLYENVSTPGHPRFVNIARASGTEDEGYGMGATWGDYDGDGRWDLHVSDYWTPYAWILSDRRWPMPPMPGASLARPFIARMMKRRSRGDGLFRNLGNHRFERASEAAGVADGGWAWGTEFVDLDGKGREDLLVVNGMFQATTGVDDEVAFWNGMGRDGVNFHDGVWGGIDFGGNGMASRTPKKLFWNRGDGTFEERAFVEGFDTLEDTRGLAYGDLDGDGAPEIVVACFRGRVLLYENLWGTASGGRIRVLLQNRSGFNRDALGAVVRLESSGRTQLREARAGSSYLSQSSRELLFGIGGSSVADRVEVRWPDGRRESTTNVPAGTRIVWFEGESPRRTP